jgi:predicted subunit of tRNA(5-methylaminomethyl-2-thiouridylate) methyltransferase
MPDNKDNTAGTASGNSKDTEQPNVLSTEIINKTYFSERISVKIPPIWISNIALWICHIEAQFNLAGITSEETKFYHLVSALDQNIICQVSEILLDNSDSPNKYSKLKKALLERFELDSETRRKKLFSGILLGDKSPSSLLREMRALAIDLNVDSSTLKHLWLQQMPSNIQAHLKISDANLDKLASMADILLRSYSPNEIASVSATEKNNLNSLQNSLTELTKKVEQLTNDLHSTRMNSANKGNYRYNNQPVNRNFDKKNKPRIQHEINTNNKLCYFHKKFGEKAFKCQSPCSFKPTGQKN